MVYGFGFPVFISNPSMYVTKRSGYCVEYNGSGFPQNVCASEKISNRDNGVCSIWCSNIWVLCCLLFHLVMVILSV